MQPRKQKSILSQGGRELHLGEVKNDSSESEPLHTWLGRVLHKRYHQ